MDYLGESSLCASPSSDNVSMEDLIPKKVQFRVEGDSSEGVAMGEPMVDSTVTWRDKLVGSPSTKIMESEYEDDLEVLEGDIQTYISNGTPSIDLLNRIFKILAQDMANTVVIKLLGRSIGFSVLQSKIYNLWKPSSSFHLMDIKNGYFLASFQNKYDCEKVLSEGPWIIFGQYLTVQPWTLSFNPAQNFPSTVMTWIRLPGLLSYFYRQKLLKEIRGLIGKVAKLDLNTDNKARGRFN